MESAGGIRWENTMPWPGIDFTNWITATLIWWNLQKYKAATLSLENSLDEFWDLKLYLLWEVWRSHLFVIEPRQQRLQTPRSSFAFQLFHRQIFGCVSVSGPALCNVSGTCAVTSDLFFREKMPQQAHKPVWDVSSPSFYVKGKAKCPNKPVQILNICLYNPIFCDLWLSLSLSSCDTSAVNMSCGGKKGEKVRMKTLPGEQILPLLHLTAALNLTLNDKVTLRRTSAEAGTIFMRNVRQRVWLPRVIDQGAVHACRDLWELSVPTVSMKC